MGYRFPEIPELKIFFFEEEIRRCMSRQLIFKA